MQKNINEEFKKRDISLLYDSNSEIDQTLLDEDAASFKDDKLNSLTLNKSSSNRGDGNLKSTDSSDEEHVMKSNQKKELLKQKCNQFIEKNNQLNC